MGGSVAPWGLHYWTPLTITLSLYLLNVCQKLILCRGQGLCPRRRIVCAVVCSVQALAAGVTMTDPPVLVALSIRLKGV